MCFSRKIARLAPHILRVDAPAAQYECNASSGMCSIVVPWTAVDSALESPSPEKSWRYSFHLRRLPSQSGTVLSADLFLLLPWHWPSPDPAGGGVGNQVSLGMWSMYGKDVNTLIGTGLLAEMNAWARMRLKFGAAAHRCATPAAWSAWLLPTR